MISALTVSPGMAPCKDIGAPLNVAVALPRSSHGPALIEIVSPTDSPDADVRSGPVYRRLRLRLAIWQLAGKHATRRLGGCNGRIVRDWHLAEKLLKGSIRQTMMCEAGERVATGYYKVG